MRSRFDSLADEGGFGRCVANHDEYAPKQRIFVRVTGGAKQGRTNDTQRGPSNPGSSGGRKPAKNFRAE